jgi:esterase/lipase superfamily enzyme
MKSPALLVVLLLVSLAPTEGNQDVVTLNGQDCGLEGTAVSEAGKDLNRHKNRYQTPADTDINPDVSLPALLAPGNDVNRFDPEKAAKVRGYVLDVKAGGKETCNCEATDPNEKDTHIELGLAADAPPNQRVIVEVTPRLRLQMKKNHIDWTTPALHQQIQGKWIEVTGWMLFDTPHIKEAENTNPGNLSNWRATCWEIHPVTSITILDKPAVEATESPTAGLRALHRLHAQQIAGRPDAKNALEKLHNSSLAKFDKKEIEEAEEESKLAHVKAMRYALPIKKDGPSLKDKRIPKPEKKAEKNGGEERADIGMKKGNGGPTPKADALSSKEFEVVRVFYGTDRKPVSDLRQGLMAKVAPFYPALAVGGLSVLLALIGYFRSRPLLKKASFIGVGFTLLLLGWPLWSWFSHGGAGPKAGDYYGHLRGSLEFGSCEVSIPKSHQIGHLEAPSILRLEMHEDPAKHIILQKVEVQSRDQFLKGLQRCLADSPNQEAFVFIHGYNVTFEEAARRTAQLAYDLNFHGAPILYSWPARGEVLEYFSDETNADWTVADLKQFLSVLATQSGAKTMHLIAHSMGNRCLTQALHDLVQETPNQPVAFKECILVAADVDADTFRTRLFPVLVNGVKRVTLYASSNDRALLMSKQINGGYPRAGESGEGIVILPKLDTIDVSLVDTSLVGHSYYGDNTSFLSDLFYLLEKGLPPDQRNRLRSEVLEGSKYWIFVP